ncbi:hypothetical protein, partial [Klebsiella pneumoniae]|uniref:hypothetical protein n=1 Tax=Klebsiella pneumoniae TaxID=573 RepID=UPI002730666F
RREHPAQHPHDGAQQRIGNGYPQHEDFIHHELLGITDRILDLWPAALASNLPTRAQTLDALLEANNRAQEPSP